MSKVIITTERFVYLLDPNDFYFISCYNDTGTSKTKYEMTYYIEMFSKYDKRELLLDFLTNKQTRDKAFMELEKAKGN